MNPWRLRWTSLESTSAKTLVAAPRPSVGGGVRRGVQVCLTGEFVSDLKALTTLPALAGNGGDHWSSMLLALCCRSAKPKCRNARSAPCPAQPLSAVENLLCETLHFPWS